MMKIILLFFTSLAFSDFVFKMQSSDFTFEEAASDKINFNGFYSACDTIDENCSCLNNRYYVTHQLVFFENGKVCEIIGRMSDSASIIKNYYRIVVNEYNLYSWGTYQLNDGKIKATINSLYFARGQRWEHATTNYEGVISSRNCIINWKAVSPYPSFYTKKLHKNLNHDFSYEMTSKSFVYKPFQAVLILKENK